MLTTDRRPSDRLFERGRAEVGVQRVRHYPERQWDRLADDRRIHAWIDGRAKIAA